MDSLCCRYQATPFTSCHPPIESSVLDLPPPEKSQPSNIGRAATRWVRSQRSITLRSWPIDLTQVLMSALAATHARPRSALISFMLTDVISVTTNIRKQIKNLPFISCFALSFQVLFSLLLFFNEPVNLMVTPRHPYKLLCTVQSLMHFLVSTWSASCSKESFVCPCSYMSSSEDNL